MCVWNRTIAMGCRQSEQAVKTNGLAIAPSCAGSLVKAPTYSCPSFIATSPVDPLPKFPSIVIPHRSDNCLGDFGRSYQEVGAVRGRQLQEPCQGGRDPVDNGEQRWMDSRSHLVHPFLRLSVSVLSVCGRMYTQVIHAPLSSPKAICQAGSSDWKYSSGWKNVLTLSAFRILNATRNRKMSCEVDTCLTFFTARL